MANHKPEAVGEMFSVSRDYVLDRVRAGDWPHLRLSQRVIRFTDADVRAIAELTHRDRIEPRKAAQDWGRITRGSRRPA